MYGTQNDWIECRYYYLRLTSDEHQIGYHLKVTCNKYDRIGDASSDSAGAGYQFGSQALG